MRNYEDQTIINLTAIMADEKEAISAVKRLNELAKPGSYYELHICKDGEVFWQSCVDEERETVPIRVVFNPKSMRLKIEVPAQVDIEINKITFV